tara:strand:+ start:802 stop:1044 length:243 start_codon:yes stop_codon:yes gene_type:complete
MCDIDFVISFLKYFIIINFIWMTFSHLMIAYVNNGYNFFKNIYPGNEEEYKKLLVLVFHFWRFFLLFFGITPFLVLLLMK